MMPPLPNWLTAIALTLLVGVVAAQGDFTALDPEPFDPVLAAQQDAEAQASRDWVALQVCGGRAYQWTADKELECGQGQRP